MAVPPPQSLLYNQALHPRPGACCDVRMAHKLDTTLPMVTLWTLSYLTQLGNSELCRAGRGE